MASRSALVVVWIMVTVGAVILTFAGLDAAKSDVVEHRPATLDAGEVRAQVRVRAGRGDDERPSVPDQVGPGTTGSTMGRPSDPGPTGSTMGRPSDPGPGAAPPSTVGEPRDDAPRGPSGPADAPPGSARGEW